MERAAIVEAYLAGLKKKEVHPNTRPFITISRESGAGGNALADELLEVLPEMLGELGEGWQKFDQELCQLVAREPKLGVSLDELISESYRSEIQCFLFDLVSGSSQQYVAYKRMFEIIRILATLGKVVIIGRGGSQITRNMPLGIRVRLVSDLETRVRTMQRILGVDRDVALKRIKDQDRDRERLVRDFFNRDIADPHLYDAVFDTQRLTVREVAELVCAMVRQRMAHYPALRA